MKIKLGYGIVLLGLMVLTGCGNLAQTAKSQYEKGEYLIAGNTIVKGLEDPNLKPEILTFIQTNGNALQQKLLTKGQQLLQKEPSLQTIAFHESLIFVLEKLELESLPTPNFSESLKQAQNQLKTARGKYQIALQKQGDLLLENKKYRSAYNTFNNLLKEFPNNPDAFSKREQSLQRALRKITLFPIQKPLDVFSQVVTAENQPSQVLQDTRPNKFEGVAIEPQILSKLMNGMRHKKSPFIYFSYDRNLTDSQYYIKGIYEWDILKPGTHGQFLRTETGTATFDMLDANNSWESKTGRMSFDVNEITYEVAFRIKAAIFLSHNHQKVGEFFAEGKGESSTQYRGLAKEIPPLAQQIKYPDEYLSYAANPIEPNKRKAFEMAMNNATQKLGRNILATIDKEKDDFWVSMYKNQP